MGIVNLKENSTMLNNLGFAFALQTEAFVVGLDRAALVGSGEWQAV